MANNDWAEVCTYIDGEHAEYELSQEEWFLVDRLLGFTTERRNSEYLVGVLIPAMVKAAELTGE